MSAHLFLGAVGAALLVAGALCLIAAWRGRPSEQLAAKALTRVTGRIVKLKNERRGSDNRPRSYPVVEFTTLSGERAILTSRYPNRDRATRQVGDSIEIQYEASDPKRAEIAGAAESGYAIMNVAGAIVLLLGAMVMMAALRG
jgi:hypothetical protein